MEFYIDEDSFGALYDRAPDVARQAFLDAGLEVDGANARAEAARRDLADLLTFRNKLDELIRGRQLGRLPPLRGAWLRPIKHWHHLTVGVWRGLFLVAPDGAAAVAAIFSRAPHDYLSRLDELLAKHQTRLSPSQRTTGETAAERDGDERQTR